MFKNRRSFWIWVMWASMAGSATVAIPEVPAQERQLAAEIIALVGNAEVKSPPEGQFRKAQLKDVLYSQDKIRTLAQSRAKLWFKDETILMLGENTALDISIFQMDNQGRRQNALFKVMEGTMRFIVHKFYSGLPPGVEVEGVTAILGVRGTDCVIEVRSPDLFLNIGHTPVMVTNLVTRQSITLPPGIWARVILGQPIATGTITPFMRRHYINQTRSGQTEVPDNVSAPPALLPGEQVVTFGNPLVPQDNPYRGLAIPSIQSQGQVQPPLPSIHHK